jgi:hypothetical protein
LNIVCFVLKPEWFSEKNWTTWKELAWTLLNISLIGLGNYLFSAWLEFFPFSWNSLFLFQSYTLAVGIFPVSITIHYKQFRWEKHFQDSSNRVSKHIMDHHKILHTQSINEPIHISNGSETMELQPSHFVFARADDNYAELYYLHQNKVAREIIRTTLKNLENLFSQHPNILRCHKSYLVNLDKVKSVSGNAQGFKLHIQEVHEVIPVSRSRNEMIQSYFANRPDSL